MEVKRDECWYLHGGLNPEATVVQGYAYPTYEHSKVVLSETMRKGPKSLTKSARSRYRLGGIEFLLSLYLQLAFYVRRAVASSGSCKFPGWAILHKLSLHQILADAIKLRSECFATSVSFMRGTKNVRKQLLKDRIFNLRILKALPWVLLDWSTKTAFDYITNY
jgi:hypothetical protein